MSLKEMMDERMIQFLVQKTIMCPITGKVLDMDTCAVVRDRDGDAVAVYAPEVLDALDDEKTETLAAKGYVVEQNPKAGV